MKLIEFFFQLSNVVKLYHWKTGSYARHKASDSLFGKIIDISDKFMEVYFGKYGKNSIKTLAYTSELLDDDKIIDYLNGCIVFLNDIVKNKLIKAIDTDLLNIRDELLAEINQTLYLFTLK
jgi:hypothetical protein